MSRILALTILVFLVGVLPAQDKETAREIDIRGLRRDFPTGKADHPTVITTADELARAFPEAEIRDRLKKEADLTKEKLLFFAWSGSGQDKLSFKTEKGEKGVVIQFNYQRGRTRDLRGHLRLFAIPKDASFRIE